MLIHSFGTRKRPVRTRSVEFGVLSPDEIRRMAVCDITNPLMYFRGLPMFEGVIDIRLGSCDRRLRCGTCNMSVQDCPGHCGKIELGVPLYHMFTDTCLKVLRSCCYFCSRLLGGEEERALNPDNDDKVVFTAVYGCARLKKCCPHCGGPQPTYGRPASGIITIDWPYDAWADDAEKAEVTQRLFTSVEAASILRGIPDADLRAMGFDAERNHPAWMVPDVLLVPPSSTRPSIMSCSGSRMRGQDEITLKYNDINKRAADLRAHIASTGWTAVDPVTPELAEKMARVQVEIFALLNTGTGATAKAAAASTQRTAVKGLGQRLRGKEGRIRGNLMGKRVDHSARSVITPDALLQVDEVGVPIAVAHQLTTPEKVTAHNIERMHARILVGAGDVTGAQSVVSKDGTVIQLQFLDDAKRKEIRLQFGDTVERFVQTGDVCIFNRQPSLHRIGFMGHRVRLYPGKTFRLNLSVTSPYNADFDGDEMNLHLPQSTPAQAEVEHIMCVGHQVVTPQSCKPVMSIVQDSLIGAWILTHPRTLLTRSQMMRLAVWVRGDGVSLTLPPPAFECPEPFWTGVQAFSLVLPEAMTLDAIKYDDGGTPPWPSEGVCIRGGELLYGRLGKSHLGTASGGVIDTMYRTLGPSVTLEFMSNEQRIIMPFLMSQGFSVSIRDVVVTAEGKRKVAEHINASRQNIEAIVHSELPESLRAMAEGTVFSLLSKLLLQAGAIGKKHMLPESSVAALVDSGSKGNQLNIAQIAGTVGQQAVGGERIFSTSSSRTLSCFDPGCKSLLANGFVESSYGKGLTPAEFFFHSMGGREGLVDTAVKTASTGYIQRRMVKALEDMHSTYLSDVRNAQGMVVQFCYGFDGWEPTLVQHARIPVLLMTDAQRRESLCDEPPTEVQLREARKLAAVVMEARAARRSILRPGMDPRTLLPFDIDQTLLRFKGGAEWLPDAQAYDAYEVHAAALADALAAHLEAAPGRRTNVIAAVRHRFSSRALRRASVPMSRLEELFAQLRDRCDEALVCPGEACGSICAQSLGEPTTQMTLNSTHTRTRTRTMYRTRPCFCSSQTRR